jgi:hypothetical protein
VFISYNETHFRDEFMLLLHLASKIFFYDWKNSFYPVVFILKNNICSKSKFTFSFSNNNKSADNSLTLKSKAIIKFWFLALKSVYFKTHIYIMCGRQILYNNKMFSWFENKMIKTYAFLRWTDKNHYFDNIFFWLNHQSFHINKHLMYQPSTNIIWQQHIVQK